MAHKLKMNWAFETMIVVGHMAEGIAWTIC